MVGGDDDAGIASDAINTCCGGSGCEGSDESDESGTKTSVITADERRMATGTPPARRRAHYLTA